MHVAVAVTVSGEPRGDLKRDNDVVVFAPEIQPDNNMEVILPVFVNRRKMMLKVALRFMRLRPRTRKTNEKRRQSMPLDSGRSIVLQMVMGSPPPHPKYL